MAAALGYAAHSPSADLSPFSFARRATMPDDVAFKVTHCRVCHSDLHQIRNEWNNSIYPMVPGHEIVGIVTEVGSQVLNFKVGDRVGVGCLVRSCGKCDACDKNIEQFCPEAVYTYNGVDIDGTTTYGGFSTLMVVNIKFLLIPESLPLDVAAPLLCAGITVYSPMLCFGMIERGKHMGVVGLGGLGHMAVKFDWRRQPQESKNRVIDHLHAQFPNPEGFRFDNTLMKARMGHVLKTRRAAARGAAEARDFKPSFLSSDDWQKVKDELRTFPNRWEQQREANRVQQETTGISRLGSGGKANFYATFEEVVGRRPSQKEYEEGRDARPKKLYERLAREGVPLKALPKAKKYADMTYVAGPNGEIESDGDDVSYVPSEDIETEEEELESEGEEAQLWLGDVDAPTSSKRRSRKN